MSETTPIYAALLERLKAAEAERGELRQRLDAVTAAAVADQSAREDRVRELEAGLKPFADYAAIVWDGAHPTNPIGDACPFPPSGIVSSSRDTNAKPLPTIGDCRRAAELLKGECR